MSQRWLNFLEQIGTPFRPNRPPESLDRYRTLKGGKWYQFRDHELLYQLFGPPEDSPWRPYHCATLFAAVDRLNIRPRPLALSPLVQAEVAADTWDWLDRHTLVVVDLPGAEAIQMGARLFQEAGCQLVSTFDHWPRANPSPEHDPLGKGDIPPRPWPPERLNQGVTIDSQDVVDAMVTAAPAIYRHRGSHLAPDLPPVWLCDARRVIHTTPAPGTFDNRYFIDHAQLPSPEKLKQHRIRRVVYFAASLDQSVSEDLTAWFNELSEGGIALGLLGLDKPDGWARPESMPAPAVVRLAGRRFPKSAVGGFGREIPVPEEGGSGGMVGAGGGG